MQSTFLFEAVKAGVPFIVIIARKGPTGMPIPHGYIALIEVGMIR
jgi:hypothetical protein